MNSFSSSRLRLHFRHRLQNLSGPARIAILLGIVVIFWLIGISFFIYRSRQHYLIHHAASIGESPISSSEFSPSVEAPAVPIGAVGFFQENPLSEKHQEFTKRFNRRKIPVLIGNQENTPAVEKKVEEKPVERKPVEPKKVEATKAPQANLPSEVSTILPNPAIVVLTYNRPQYLSRSVSSLFNTSGIESFTLYVSQDGQQPDFSALLKQLAEENQQNKKKTKSSSSSSSPSSSDYQEIHYLTHLRESLLSSDQSSTAYLAQHYKKVLNQLFNEFHHSHVILLEDDLMVSPDFLDYFLHTVPVYNEDPSIFCISSWNDHGMNSLVIDPTRIFRTSFFPGLGWMIKKDIWDEISPVFPLDQWDHFMRLDTIHKGRDCLVPEISRNRNIGAIGTNMASGFFEKYLAPIAFQESSILSDHLAFQSQESLYNEEYERLLTEQIHSATLLGYYRESSVKEKLSAIPQETRGKSYGKSFIILYRRPEWIEISQQFQILSVPRSIHKGIILLRRGWNSLIFIDQFLGSQYLFQSEYHYQSRNYSIQPGKEGENCEKTCQTQGKSCVQESFQALNECSVLMKYFPCLKGCRGGVWGFDVPNYVSSEKKPELFGYCLTTEADSQCGADHWSAQRLCPCA